MWAALHGIPIPGDAASPGSDGRDPEEHPAYEDIVAKRALAGLDRAEVRDVVGARGHDEVVDVQPAELGVRAGVGPADVDRGAHLRFLPNERVVAAATRVHVELFQHDKAGARSPRRVDGAADRPSPPDLASRR